MARKKLEDTPTLEELSAARRKKREDIAKAEKLRKAKAKEKAAIRKTVKSKTIRSRKTNITEEKALLIEAMDESQLKLSKKESQRARKKAKDPSMPRKNAKSVLTEEERQAAADAAFVKAEKQRLKRQEDLAVRRATQVELELARRELARRKLLPFIKKFKKTYDAGWVHEHICNQLEKFVKRIENQESPRLMIFMPPRHGKSEIASKNLPAWVLGKHPEWEIIASSYAVSLPTGFSRSVQATIQDKAYQQLFPNTKLHPKAQAAEAWMTTMEGGYVAAGVGGGITGKGAHMFIIDDPVKDAQEADSDTQRQTVWDWWGSTAKTRLAPGGGALVIQTRWHDDDLAGRMIMQMQELIKEFDELIKDAKHNLKIETAEYKKKLIRKEIEGFEQELAEIDRWEIIVYPAVATKDEYIDEEGILVHDPEPEQIQFLTKVREEGEALHSSRYPIGRLRNMKRSMQPRHWSALYQQNPVPDEGIYFTKDMIKFTASLPAITDMYLFAAWDLAVGEKQHNDFSVGVVLGLDYQGQIHVVEMVRLKADIHVTAEAVLSMYKRYPSILEIGIEKGQLELSLMPQLNKLLRKEKLYPTFNHELRPISDKWVRARPLQGRMQMGMLLFPHNQPWTDNAVGELLRFPGGIHDDIVDALAWGVRMIGSRKEPPSPTARNSKSWKDKLTKYTNGVRISNTPMGA